MVEVVHANNLLINRSVAYPLLSQNRSMMVLTSEVNLAVQKTPFSLTGTTSFVENEVFEKKVVYERSVQILLDAGVITSNNTLSFVFSSSFILLR